jgi:hypothetical protein
MTAARSRSAQRLERSKFRAAGGFSRAARPPTRSLFTCAQQREGSQERPLPGRAIPHAFDRPAQSGLDRRLLESPGRLYPEHDPFWILDLFP